MAGNELDFGGRVAIVTGAGQGMGREHAIMLASRGARVVVNDIVESDAQQVAREITDAGGVPVADSHDVVCAASDLVQTATAEFGQLDIVVNNAGINAYGRFWEMESDKWWRVFDVSFRGVAEVSRYAMPRLIESDSGRLINISSHGLVGSPFASAYCSAKAEAILKVLREQFPRMRCLNS